MKKLLNKCFYYYFIKKLKTKMVIGDNCIFNRESKINLLHGSNKEDISLDNRVVMLGY